MSKRPAQRGFTLIELMITVTVIAILAAVAYPSYASHIRKSRRAEAQQALMEVASRQQQYLLDTRGYSNNLTPFFNAGLSFSPSVLTSYTVQVTATTVVTAPPAFTATAAPLGNQTLDTCGTMTVTEAGVKSPATCW